MHACGVRFYQWHLTVNKKKDFYYGHRHTYPIVKLTSLSTCPNTQDHHTACKTEIMIKVNQLIVSVHILSYSLSCVPLESHLEHTQNSTFQSIIIRTQQLL